MNPLDRIKQIQAEAGIEPVAAITTAALSTGIGKLEQYQAAVDAALSAMASMTALREERTAHKKTVLAEIMPFVGAYVDGGDRYPNSVAVQAMIWLFDVGEIEQALNLGLYLIRTGQQHMPPRFKRRELEPFVCQAIYDWANAQLKAQASAAPYLDQLIEAMEAEQWTLHPLVSSMVYVMSAKHAERNKDYPRVVALCEKAEAVNPDGAGVKTLMNTARAKLSSA